MFYLRFSTICIQGLRFVDCLLGFYKTKMVFVLRFVGLRSSFCTHPTPQPLIYTTRQNIMLNCPRSRGLSPVPPSLELNEITTYSVFIQARIQDFCKGGGGVQAQIQDFSQAPPPPGHCPRDVIRPQKI